MNLTMKRWNWMRISLVASLGASLVAAPLLGHVPRRTVISGSVVIAKWVQPSAIAWRANPGLPPNVTGSTSLETTFRQAFAAWSAVSTATIGFGEQPASASLKPGLDQVSLIIANLTAAEFAAYGADAISFTNVTTSVTTGHVLEADILFNPNIAFSTEASATPSGSSDLQAVATHEIGHLLGLDHSPLASAVMFPLATGRVFSRTLTLDDTIGVSTLYPTAAFTARGSIEGTVRTMANVGVFGAIVVVVGQNGQPFASTITDPEGKYSISGLPAGNYTMFAEPLDGPFAASDLLAPLSTLYPGKTVNSDFTTRFR
jgi:hypothetical protein